MSTCRGPALPAMPRTGRVAQRKPRWGAEGQGAGLGSLPLSCPLVFGITNAKQDPRPGCGRLSRRGRTAGKPGPLLGMEPSLWGNTGSAPGAGPAWHTAPFPPLCGGGLPSSLGHTRDLLAPPRPIFFHCSQPTNTSPGPSQPVLATRLPPVPCTGNTFTPLPCTGRGLKGAESSAATGGSPAGPGSGPLLCSSGCSFQVMPLPSSPNHVLLQGTVWLPQLWSMQSSPTRIRVCPPNSQVRGAGWTCH